MYTIAINCREPTCCSNQYMGGFLTLAFAVGLVGNSTVVTV